MISRSDVFEMHKLWNQGFTKRQIAGKLQLDRGTVTKCLANPDLAIKYVPHRRGDGLIFTEKNKLSGISGQLLLNNEKSRKL